MLCHKEIRSDTMSKNKYPIGFKFNKLTIIDYLENNRCLCKCECGKIINIKNSHINEQISCGCGRIKYPIGYRFNRLTIISIGEKIDNSSEKYYKCQCDCGKIIYLRANRINKQKSCGCSTKYNIKHCYKTKTS